MISTWVGFLRARGWRPAVILGYLAVLAIFAQAFASFHIQGKGFTYLVAFGSRQEERRVDALKGLNYYVQSDSDGYDAQYYVQIAMDPTLDDPQLKTAVDSLPYRARRILISWLAYVMGAGRPAWILDAYVLQNLLAWVALAATMLWWFPPSSWTHLARWAGVLFSFGVCVSVRNSLVDGPSLCLIAIGVMLLESGRRWGATAVLALGGLGKETNLLGGAALLEPGEVGRLRRWPGLALRSLLLVLPFALWLWYIQVKVGPAADLGARNFDWPLVAYMRKWFEVCQGLQDPENWRLGWMYCGPLLSALMMVTLTVQLLFLLLRPAPRHAWWRVGLSFAVLMLVLGDAVWEGFPGAASRVLLPMQLAFNVLVPRGRAWWPVLLLGNLTVLGAPIALQPPYGDGYKLQGSERLVTEGENGLFRIQFSREWYQAEKLRDRYWRWSRDSSRATLINPHAFPVDADLDFILSALEPKRLTVATEAGTVLWSGRIGNFSTRVHVAALELRPGRNVLRFTSGGDTANVQNDPRALDFCLKDFVVRLSPAAEDGVALMGRRDLLSPAAGPGVRVAFDDGWYAAESSDATYWRWSHGPGGIVVRNPFDHPLRAKVSFTLNAISKRDVKLTGPDGRELWSGEVASRHSEDVLLPDVALAPGENHFRLAGNLPPSGADNDSRLLDLCLKNLVVEVSR